jgi:hypothetical protein
MWAGGPGGGGCLRYVAVEWGGGAGWIVGGLGGSSACGWACGLFSILNAVAFIRSDALGWHRIPAFNWNTTTENYTRGTSGLSARISQTQTHG